MGRIFSFFSVHPIGSDALAGVEHSRIAEIIAKARLESA
jgi:hypothetical protein